MKHRKHKNSHNAGHYERLEREHLGNQDAGTGIFFRHPVSAQNTEWRLMPQFLTEEMEAAFADAWYSKQRSLENPELADVYEALKAAAPWPAVGAPAKLNLAFERALFLEMMRNKGHDHLLQLAEGIQDGLPRFQNTWAGNMWECWIEAKRSCLNIQAYTAAAVKSSRPANLQTWPAQIHLLAGDGIPLPDFRKCREITWATDQATSTNVKYVRADLIHERDIA